MEGPNWYFVHQPTHPQINIFKIKKRPVTACQFETSRIVFYNNTMERVFKWTPYEFAKQTPSGVGEIKCSSPTSGKSPGCTEFTMAANVLDVCNAAVCVRGRLLDS